MLANYVYRQPPQYRPQLYRARPIEPYVLRWLYSRATQQYQVLTSIDADSHLFGTVAQAGDIEVVPLLTDQGHAVTLLVNGIVIIDYAGTDRQILTPRDLYLSASAAFDQTIPGTLVINDHDPAPVTPTPPIFADQVIKYQKDAAITPVDYEALVIDSDGDAITVTFEADGPSGLSFSSGDLTGTPDTYEETTATVRWSGLYGGYYEELVSYLIGESAPDVVGETEADAITAIEALANFTVAQPSATASHPTIPAGSVISQDPPADEIVADDTEFALVVSSGPATGSSRGMTGYGFGFGFGRRRRA